MELRLLRKTFYFMRHGQTDWNYHKRIQGQTDILLNDHGRKQATDAQKHIGLSCNIKKIFYSPMQRVQETMALASGHLDIPKIDVHDLKEWHMGTLEGTTPEERLLLGELYFDNPPMGETKIDFFERTLRGINFALSHEDEPILIVGHSGTFRALCHYTNNEFEHIENCEVVLFSPATFDAGWDIKRISL